MPWVPNSEASRCETGGPSSVSVCLTQSIPVGRFPPPAVASLHQWSLPSTCGHFPTCGRLPRLQSLPSPAAISSLQLTLLPYICYRHPPPVIALLHLRSLPSTCGRFPPPVIAALHRRTTGGHFPPPAVRVASLHLAPARLLSLPSTCGHFPPPVIAPFHLLLLAPPAIASLHLLSLAFTFDRFPLHAIHISDDPVVPALSPVTI
jgi:hypothetical protein